MEIEKRAQHLALYFASRNPKPFEHSLNSFSFILPLATWRELTSSMSTRKPRTIWLKSTTEPRHTRRKTTWSRARAAFKWKFLRFITRSLDWGFIIRTKTRWVESSCYRLARSDDVNFKFRSKASVAILWKHMKSKSPISVTRIVYKFLFSQRFILTCCWFFRMSWFGSGNNLKYSRNFLSHEC